MSGVEKFDFTEATCLAVSLRMAEVKLHQTDIYLNYLNNKIMQSRAWSKIDVFSVTNSLEFVEKNPAAYIS